jgi:RHS repeat-associated protein
LHLLHLLAFGLACIGLVTARAELVTMEVKHSGGTANAMLRVTLGAQTILLEGSAADEAQSIALEPDETTLLQVTGEGVGDYQITFNPPAHYATLINGYRQAAYSSAFATPRPVNHILPVTLVRREARTAGAQPLGQASTIAWHPPKTLGYMAPYIDFHVGQALNGEPLPSLRIPLLPRFSSDAPLTIDLPDCSYSPTSGGFELITPQVVVRLSLDPQTAGHFHLSFHSDLNSTPFARYNFLFPLWPLAWNAARQVRVVNDGSVSGIGRNYETSIEGFFTQTGMGQIAPANSWTISDWRLEGHSPLRTITARRDAIGGGREDTPFTWYLSGTLTDTIEVKGGASESAAAEKIVRVYQSFDRNNDAPEVLFAPLSITSGVSPRTYVTQFFQDPRAPTVLGTRSPTQYHRFVDTDSSESRIHETWLDNSPTFDATAGAGSKINSNQSAITTIAYDTSPALVGYRLPVSKIRKVGTATIGRETSTYALNGDILTAQQATFATADPGDHVLTTLRWYRPDAPAAILRQRPHSVHHASGAQQSFGYKSASDELQIAILSGTVSGGNTVTGLPDFGNVASIQLHPHRSTLTVETFRRGLLTRRETRVYIGGIGNAPAFNSGDPVTWENFEYTADGRLRRRSASNNTSYEAEWSGSRKRWERDETGLKTTFHHDAMDRVVAVETESAAGLPAQTVSFTYDAAHRIRFRRVGPVDANGLPAPASEQLVTEFRYDQGGRLAQRIDPGGATDGSYAAQGITTSYQYSHGDRDVVETRAGSDRSVTRYADGRPHTVSGTAVVTPETSTYALDASGRNAATVVYAGQRPRITLTDWLGRETASQINGPIQEGGFSRPIVTTLRYDSRGLLATSSVAEMNGTTPLPLSAERRFEYDEFGALRASGLDLDGTPGLQASATDRFTDSETRFYADANGTWWLLTTTKLYHTNGAATFHTGQRFNRLTGFASGQTSQVDHLDFHNNRTSESTVVNSFQKTRVVTAQAADSTKRVTTTVGALTLSEQRFNDAGGADQPATYTYDAQGRLRQVTSPRGIVTRHEYHSGTAQRRRTYDGRNELGQEIATATFTYDANGRVAGVTDALGRTTTTTYYPNGLVRDRGGDGAHPLHYEYDQHGQLRELWTFRNGTGGTADKTRWEYDVHTGWLTRKTDAAGRSIGFTYRHASPYRVVTRTSPRSGLTTTYRYRLDTGELASVDYADGTPDIAYTHTRTGQLDTVTDATGTRDYLYDREQLAAEHLGAWYGNLVLTSLPDDTTVQNPAANRVPGRHAGFALGYVPTGGSTATAQDLAREVKVALGYDDFGRPNAVTVSHGGQASATFAYDYTPNSSFWRTRSSGPFRHERAPEATRNELKSASTSWGATLISQHVHTTSDTGELSSIQQRGALFSDYGSEQEATSVAYGYNAIGELTSATSYVGTTNPQPMPGRVYSFGYDTAGNRKHVGVDSNQADYFGSPGVPGANALNQVRERDTLPGRASGTTHPEAGLSVAGASVSRTPGSRYWDAMISGWGKFTELSVTASRYGHSQSASLWRLIRPTREGLDYDEEGNLIADSQWRYAYDAENRLVRMTTRSEAELPGLGWVISPPRRELHFKYDHLGRRVEKTAFKNGAMTFSRRFVYAGWNLIAEFELVNGAPNLRRSYAWGLDVAGSLDATGGIGALVLQTIHQGATRTHYHVAADGNGSVTALLDLNGNAAAIYEYDPFGQLLRAEGATATETVASADQPGDNPFRYSTKYWDRETGLYDYGLRFYDPSLGRFINRDPIAEAGGANLYAFAGNSPVNRFDYLGLNDRARPFGPADYVWGPTPESPGEDGSYRSRSGVDIRENAELPRQWGTDVLNSVTRENLRLLRDVYGQAEGRWIRENPGQFETLGVTPYYDELSDLNWLINYGIPAAVWLHNRYRDESLQVTAEQFDLGYDGHLQYLLIVNAGADLAKVWATAAAGEIAAIRLAATTKAGGSGLADANFAQIGINRAGVFSPDGIAKYSALAGRPIRTVDDLAGAIRAGDIKASQVVVDYVVLNGQKVILNTRTSTALARANAPQSTWAGRNVTGMDVPGMPGVKFDDLALAQTTRSKLPPTGTPIPPR